MEKHTYPEPCECGVMRHHQVEIGPDGPLDVTHYHWHGDNPEHALKFTALDHLNAWNDGERNLYTEWLDRIHSRENAHG